MNLSDAYTNDPWFWREMGLDRGPDIFWRLYHEVNGQPTAQDLSKALGWNSARHIILMNCEGHETESNLGFDPRVQTIQPIDIAHSRHHFFPWWYDWMRQVEDEIQNHQLLEGEKEKRPTHIFDAMLGTPYPRKQWLAQRIKQKTPDCFLWNIGVPWNGSGTPGSFLHGTDLHTSPDWSRPVYNQRGDWCNHGLLLPWKIYNQTWFSIILETKSDGWPMVTEKSGKCLLGRRLFVNFGNAGVLKLIRRMGYRTFGDIINESYDDELDENKRFDMAWDQVEYLLRQNPMHIIDKILPILDHNQRLFLDQDHDETLKNIIKRITNEL